MSAPTVDSRELSGALEAWPGLSERGVARLPGGLINHSYSVRGEDGEYVLQQVSPIFSPGIHENILAVTEHLHEKGVRTPRLVPTKEQALFADLGEGGIWRLMTRIPGVSFDVCESVDQARAAGTLLACFHGALEDLDHPFQPVGIPLHDTAAHLAALERALETRREHRLHPEVAPLAAQIFTTAEGWEELPSLPERAIHGDPKFNNVLFAGSEGVAKHEAICLIDFDTVSRQPLWIELGDAWRSWCNRHGEDVAEAEFDLDLFRASAQGYLGALSIELRPDERLALALAPERISLELAARFAADALCESYFGWDPAHFSSHGEHNLTRARGQLSLHRQARETREERIRVLGI